MGVQFFMYVYKIKQLSLRNEEGSYKYIEELPPTVCYWQIESSVLIKVLKNFQDFGELHEFLCIFGPTALDKIDQVTLSAEQLMIFIVSNSITQRGQNYYSQLNLHIPCRVDYLQNLQTEKVDNSNSDGYFPNNSLHSTVHVMRDIFWFVCSFIYSLKTFAWPPILKPNSGKLTTKE